MVFTKLDILKNRLLCVVYKMLFFGPKSQMLINEPDCPQCPSHSENSA